MLNKDDLRKMNNKIDEAWEAINEVREYLKDITNPSTTTVHIASETKTICHILANFQYRFEEDMGVPLEAE